MAMSAPPPPPPAHEQAATLLLMRALGLIPAAATRSSHVSTKGASGHAGRSRRGNPGARPVRSRRGDIDTPCRAAVPASAPVLDPHCIGTGKFDRIQVIG